MTQDIKRILYATDLSDNSAYAFGYALDLAKKYNAEITILHVLDIMMGMSANMVGVYFNEKQLEENLQKRIQEYMILLLPESWREWGCSTKTRIDFYVQREHIQKRSPY